MPTITNNITKETRDTWIDYMITLLESYKKDGFLTVLLEHNVEFDLYRSNYMTEFKMQFISSEPIMRPLSANDNT